MLSLLLIFLHAALVLADVSLVPPCALDCSDQFTLVIVEASNPDPHAGCPEFLATAQTCLECLVSTNSSVTGAALTLDPFTVALVIALCECPTPACDQFVLGTNQCLVNNNADPLCSCPTIVKYGPECNECIKLKDPVIGAGLEQVFIPQCQQAVGQDC